MRHSAAFDYTLRTKLNSFELPTYCCLRSNSFLSHQVRARAAVYFFFKKTHFNGFRNYCFLTGRSHGTLREFKLSRFNLKSGVGFGLFFGLKKSSW